MCEYLKKISWIIFLLISFLIIGYFIQWLVFLNYFSNSNRLVDYTDDISFYTSMAIILVTAILGLIAWYKLEKINKTNADEHLFKIDAKWHSEVITEAREIIHKFFDREYNKGKKAYYVALYNVSLTIFTLSKTEDTHFIKLLSLLEFLDTIGFFYKNGDEKLKEHIKATLSDSTIFYYECFRLYIKNNEKNNPKRFQNIRYLYDELTKQL